MTLFADLLSTVFERRYRLPGRYFSNERPLEDLADELVGSAGETSGLALAQDILSGFENLDDGEKLAFFRSIAGRLNIDPEKVRAALDAYEGSPSKATYKDFMEVTGFNESWWLGLSALHTLFAREHNTVCDALRREYRDWSDERIYQTARLVISALIAKIHTVEWTPAILATPEIDVALNANWSGPAGAFTRMGLWLQEAHALRGIPDTLPDHHGARYCLTEDFVTVYRLHPLLPDDYRIHDSQTGTFREKLEFNDIQGIRTDEVMALRSECGAGSVSDGCWKE